MRRAIIIGMFSMTVFATVGAQSNAADAIDRQVSVTLRKRFAIGGAADDRFTPNMLFARDIAVDTLGRLYLLDRSQHRVLIFDAAGKLLKTIGRSGSGPGEFRNVSSIGVSGDGALVVGDFSKRALVRFDVRGQPMPEISMRGKGYLQGILTVSSAQMTLDLTYGDTTVLLHRGASDQRLVVSPPHAKKPAPAWNVACGLIDQSSAPLLSAQTLVAGNGRDVVANEHGSYTITLFGGAAAPVRLERRKRQSRATVADARRLLGDSLQMWVGQKPCSVLTATVAEQTGVAAVVPAYQSLAISRTRQVWARRTGADKSPTIVDLFSFPTGYVGTASLGRANPVAFLSDGALVSLERDEDDAPVVVVYDITQKN